MIITPLLVAALSTGIAVSSSLDSGGQEDPSSSSADGALDGQPKGSSSRPAPDGEEPPAETEAPHPAPPAETIVPVVAEPTTAPGTSSAGAPDTAGAAAAVATSTEVPRPTTVIVARFGSMLNGGSNGSTLVAPSVGLGLERWLGRTVGIGLRYDGSVSERGTSQLSVTRFQNLASLTLDARVAVHPAAVLHVGLGGGAAWTLVTSEVLGSSRTAGDIEGGVAWLASYDITIPSTRFGATVGGSGLVRRTQDTTFFAGLRIALD